MIEQTHIFACIDDMMSRIVSQCCSPSISPVNTVFPVISFSYSRQLFAAAFIADVKDMSPFKRLNRSFWTSKTACPGVHCNYSKHLIGVCDLQAMLK